VIFGGTYVFLFVTFWFQKRRRLQAPKDDEPLWRRGFR
jgi:hypothetical protein